MFRAALVHGVEALSLNQLIWKIEEFDITGRFQPDVPATARQRLLDAARREGRAEGGEPWMLEDLWHACLEGFQLSDFDLHPEDLGFAAESGEIPPGAV